MDLDPARCYGRLSFTVPQPHPPICGTAFEKKILSILEQHGLTEFQAAEKPTIENGFSRLFEFPSLTEFFSTRKALQQDPAWKQVLHHLEEECGASGSTDFRLGNFDIFSTPAGPGETTPAGPGNRLGLWQSFCVRDGLSSASINSVLQDRRGDLWMVTSGGGVCRFDGGQFTNFTTRDGLASTTLWSILEDRNGHLWFGTDDQGVSCYDGQRFVNFTTEDGLAGNGIGAIFEDRDGHLWFTTGYLFGTLKAGMSRFDGSEFTTFTTRDGLADDQILSIAQDRAGHLWFGSLGAGGSRFDGSEFTTFTTRDGLAGDTVTAILEDRRGYLWFATGWLETGKGGVSCFDGEQFTTFTTRDGLADDDILSIAEDQGGRLWFGTYGQGVSCFDGSEFTTFTTQDGLAGNQIWSIFEDRQGHLWFGTQGGGLSRYDGAHCASFTMGDGLADNGVMCIHEDREGGVWFGTWRGACHHDGVGFFCCEELAERNVQTILEDCEGRLWFGTADGEGAICGVGGKRGSGFAQTDLQFTSFTLRDGLAGDSVFAIAEDRNGHLWFGCGGLDQGGICRYDGNTFFRFTSQESLAGKHVNAILEDRSGRIWVASWGGGVSCYDGERCINFTARDGLAWDSILAIAEDRDGNFWFGTFGHGVSRYDGEQFATFTARDGLPSNTITSIIEDDQGHLWFGTYGGGVSRYDGLVFQSFSREDGLIHDAVQDLHQDSCGNIWVATEGGVTRYRPWHTPPSVQVTDLVADRRYRADQGIHLPASQRVITFKFQGCSFTTAPGQMAFVYRLEGHDPDWLVAYSPWVEYQDLELGTYTFHVRAVDRDLNYSEIASVALTIEPDPRLEALTRALSASGSEGEFIGGSDALLQVQHRLAEVAPTDLTILILGETGAGKGLAARTVHRLSRVGDGPFIQVSCGAIPQGLVESELFGHERGAFTGAVSRKLGKVELAAGGTLFLDEIGDLALEAQGKLLRLLEERTFERVGGTKTLVADARVVAATNRDLRKMVAEERFREDLYFRLRPFPVWLPPLRERREDIELLALCFMERMAAHLSKPIERLSPEAMCALQAYDWPGNVRELEHVVQRAVIVCPGPVVRGQDIFLEPDRMDADPSAETLPLEEHERRYIQEVLEKSDWVVSGKKGAATLLGLRESTLRSRMKKLGIERPGK